MPTHRPFDTDHLGALRPHLPALAAIWDAHADRHRLAGRTAPTLLICAAVYRASPDGAQLIHRLRVVLPSDDEVRQVWREAGPAMAAYLTDCGLSAVADANG